MLAGFFLLFIVIVFDAVVDHVQAQHQQQGEGDPVVPAFSKAGGDLADTPTDHRGDGLDSAEYQTGTQRFDKARFMQACSFTKGRSKSVRGHGKREKEEGNRVHGYIQSGYESTTQPHARL
ncbi:Unknown protein sequence [Pseudomonas savastanoi pv. glycinea]|nr:Unknown protein sequence [Pseudomonas savastanoi pv. glycinea]KPC51497.1 Unknown protein sequence [Pseudomonas savastanoi pv. glycinea]